jgi:hypothetical protein
VSLVKPAELRDALHWISTDLHLEIHQYKDLLPCYLLGRVRRHWSADHLLDEMYVSPRNDFFLDACFVTLKQGGHPQGALRLSGLRARTLRGSARTAADVTPKRLRRGARGGW